MQSSFGHVAQWTSSRSSFAVRKVERRSGTVAVSSVLQTIRPSSCRRLSVCGWQMATRWASNCKLVKHETRQDRRDVRAVPGKRRLVADRCTETTLWLREPGPAEKRWQIVVRAYDDGVAWRYRFPAQDGWQQLELAEERTEFKFPPAATATLLPLAGFTTSHENRYRQQSVAEISAEGADRPAAVGRIARTRAGRRSSKQISPTTPACTWRRLTMIEINASEPALAARR